MVRASVAAGLGATIIDEGGEFEWIVIVEAAPDVACARMPACGLAHRRRDISAAWVEDRGHGR